jgi:hypothetical protein
VAAVLLLLAIFVVASIMAPRQISSFAAWPPTLNEGEISKEGFAQSYLQYRWLDDTRIRLLDRFFVVALAAFGARVQFNAQLSEKPAFLWSLWVFPVPFAVLLARSIVRFRRQQRGHGHYIHAVRRALIDRLLSGPTDPDVAAELHLLRQYTVGRRVRLTTWVELLVGLLAVGAPLIAVGDLVTTRSIYGAGKILMWIAGSVIAFLSLLWILVPWYKYNFTKVLEYERD